MLVPDPVDQGDDEPQGGEQPSKGRGQQRRPRSKHKARRQVHRSNQRQQQQDQTSNRVPVPGGHQLGPEPLAKDGPVVPTGPISNAAETADNTRVTR